MTIRLRLVVAFLILNGVAMFFLIDWVRNELRPRYLEGIEESLNDFAHLAAAAVSGLVAQGGDVNAALEEVFSDAYGRRLEAKIYDLIKTEVDLRLYITDDQGIVVFDSLREAVGKDYSRWNDVRRTLQGEYGARSTRTDQDDPTTSVIHVAAPIMIDGRIKGVLTVAKPPDMINAFLSAARKKVTWVGIASTLIMTILAVSVSTMVTRPLLRLRKFTQDVARGLKPVRPRFRTREVSELADAVVQMREALEGRQYIENYVQNLTHEIKGPLAGIRSAAELLEEPMAEADRRKFLTNIARESMRLQTIAERLLQLAGVERHQVLAKTVSIDLTRLLAHACQPFQDIASLKGINLRVEKVEEGLTVEGDEFLLGQAIANLVQNAVDFSVPGGVVCVAAWGEQHGGQRIISVSNEGMQIPDYAMGRIFERFYSLPRPGSGQKSSGLGLSFVQEIARLHRGRIDLKNTDRGVTATLIFDRIDEKKA